VTGPVSVCYIRGDRNLGSGCSSQPVLELSSDVAVGRTITIDRRYHCISGEEDYSTFFFGITIIPVLRDGNVPSSQDKECNPSSMHWFAKANYIPRLIGRYISAGHLFQRMQCKEVDAAVLYSLLLACKPLGD